MLSAAPAFRPLHLADLCPDTRDRTDWLWDGYLAPGAVTLLTSLWKSGKTTLVSVLLARLGNGGTLAGRAVRPGRAVVVSEEDPSMWGMRDRRQHIGQHVGFLCQPFPRRPTPAEWQALLDELARERRIRGLDLLVIDPLATFLPARTENHAGAMLDALGPLQRLAREGVAVLVLHHPRKGESAAGQAARGSGALAGMVDVLVEMSYVGRSDSDDRRRRLIGFSRHPETPHRLLIERTADGTDYAVLPDVDDGNPCWELLRSLLTDAGSGLTRLDVLDRWPPDQPPPNETTLWRWLERAVRDGRLLRTGSGRRNDPFRYRVVEEDGDGVEVV